VDNSKDEFDFCLKVCASVFILEVLRPAGETRVGRNAFGAGLLAVLSGDETKAFSVASATFAPRSSAPVVDLQAPPGAPALEATPSPVRPHLQAWMLREGEADLIARDRHL
jgi:hypothetical protein